MAHTNSRLPLAEALFFLAHDEFTGKAQVARASLEICLSGAIICDLLFTGRISVNDGCPEATGKAARGDRASAEVLAEIAAEPTGYPLREWIDHLRPVVVDKVVTQLADAGLVTPIAERSLLRRTHRYPPVDLLVAAGGRAEIRAAVLGPGKPDVYNVSLALLAWHLGLDDLCEPQLDRRMLRAWLDRAAKPMPPAASEVLAAVESAIAASVYGGERR
ncbi:GPP34 family phosphoprotein [Kutzneria sp. 744]|uniref:GOLPH3/VPS74 family protein n=1 Tax=Kutzneria sp. (strain 744) TaxID=345341 RepID=UPI0003EEA470|nr:GPP34 family phosphoprotein [Kutzneria sp. 744]EWM15776.1 LigA protein [Kutzneria sp. 744]